MYGTDHRGRPVHAGTRTDREHAAMMAEMAERDRPEPARRPAETGSRGRRFQAAREMGDYYNYQEAPYEMQED